MRGLGTFEFGLGGVERDLVRRLFDDEQQVALFDGGAIFEQDLFEIAVDASPQVDGRRGLGAADELDRIGDGLFDRLRDRDLRRRRRDELVLRLAAGEQRRKAAKTLAADRAPAGGIGIESRKKPRKAEAGGRRGGIRRLDNYIAR